MNHRFQYLAICLILAFLTILTAACGDTPSTPTAPPIDTIAPAPDSTPTPPPVPPTYLDALPLRLETSRSYPQWAQHARIAGAYFEPGEDDDLDARLDALADQRVSVVLADCPLGSYYSAWADDVEFAASLDLIRRVTDSAHQRGLKVVLYLTSLEQIAEEGAVGERNPATAHPEWVQISLHGDPLAFSDISSAQEHWLEEGQIDVWMAPRSGYRDFYLDRVREIMDSGVDGLWIDVPYLPEGIGGHDELWPSHDPFSAEAFQAAYGLDLPEADDWDDEAWRKWIVWRHQDLRDFLLAVKDEMMAANPDAVFFEENWSADTSGATSYGNDPAIYAPLPDVTTGHEIGTIADRMDEGETGMAAASPEEWQAFATMIKFARGADRAKPSWILTYGYQPEDGVRLAGVIASQGANYYETRGPAMDDTVGEDYRRQIFEWTAAREAEIFDTASLAQVALLHSSRNLDLIDQGGAQPYGADDEGFFQEYRAAAATLLSAHVPFDIVVDTGLTLDHLRPYRWLILPWVECMSDDQAALIRDFAAGGGRVILVGDTGWADEWLEPRDDNALEDVPAVHIETVASESGGRELIEALEGLPAFDTNAPPEVMVEMRGGPGLLTLALVNLGREPVGNMSLNLAWPEGLAVNEAGWTTPTGDDAPLDYELEDGLLALTIPDLSAAGLAVIRWSE